MSLPSHPFRSSRLRTRLAATATVAALALSLAACGDDADDDNDADEPRGDSSSQTSDGGETSDGSETTDGGETTGGTLTQEQVEQATLSIDNVGAGWTQDPAEEEDDSEGPGCVGEIGKLTDSLEKAAGAETGFSYGEQGLPQVNSKVSTYADEAAVIDVFDQVETGIENCPTINWESEGFTYDLTLQPTTDVAGIEVDDQNGFVASGSFTTPDGQESPIFLHINYLRVGPTVATVGVTDVQSRAAEQEQYTVIGANRLNAVIAGEEPPAETGPAIG